ncbi:MAG TPA: helix-turn-helix domain-containing protein [Candidatus Dormibacteraeota bacterium]|nr:helix-turn-helix domain-containing protein [Candidatus Dormibacteraeota bacterium]
MRRGWRQHDLAVAARVSQSTVSRLERGHLDKLPTATIRRVMAALDLRVELRVRWRGGELDRLLDRAHATLGEAVVRWLVARGWEVRPEVSFARYGERGVIDVLARHPASGSLLAIELKTALVDLQELMASIDRKVRLAAPVAASLGWQSTTVSGLVVVAQGRTNRRRVADHRRLLRAAFPTDGRRMRAWLRQPAEPVRGLMFWPDSHGQHARPPTSSRQRVSRGRLSVVRVAGSPNS